MNRDRLGTLLRVRDIVERRRQAEQADATRVAAEAAASHADAVATRAAAELPVGAVIAPAALSALRCGAIALDDAVLRASTERTLADRELGLAEQRTVVAAVQRRSAERLRDRRAASLAAEEARVESRRADDVALQVWRKR